MKAYPYAAALVVTVVTNLVLWRVRESLTLANAASIYLMVVVIIAVRYGTGPSWLASVLNFGGFNFFLIRPYYTFEVADTRELLDLVVFLIVAAITGQLAAHMRLQAANLRVKADEQEILYKLTSTFNQAMDKETVFTALKQVLVEDMALPHSVILPYAEYTSAAMYTDRHVLYVLLRSDEVIYGTVCVPSLSALSPSSRRLLMACAQQAAMALQRVDLAEQAQQSKNLEEADRLKTTLLHAVSHDLRTPLTIIKTTASNMLNLRQQLPEHEMLELLHTIQQESDHLNKLVGNLLDMSRLKAGAMTLHSSLNSLEEVVGDVAARVWELTRQERIHITFAEDFPLVCFDYGLMLQAVGNLVENSLRYEPEHGKIEILGSVHPQHVHLYIINHGPSLPVEERQKVLEPFYHGQEGHIGLGLPIASGIVEAHHGRLWIEDTPGGGVTFVIALPCTAMEKVKDEQDSGGG